MVFAKHLTFTVPFSTKECKWVALNCQGGPLRGEVILLVPEVMHKAPAGWASWLKNRLYIIISEQ